MTTFALSCNLRAAGDVAPSPAPPRLVQLPAHHPVLRRGPDAAQVGVLPGRAVEALGLSPPLLRLLFELHGSWPLDMLVSRAVELGADEASARAVLGELVRVGALVDAASTARAARARAEATVLVQGAGPLLAGVASGLAAAGIGTLHLEIGGSQPAGGAGVAELRETTSAAVLADVRRLALTTEVRSGPPRRRPDLAVLTDALAPDPDLLRALARRGVPALIVRLTDGIGLVGPLVLPGRSACPRCLDLHRAAHDPRWPVAAASLAGRVGSASPGTVAATAGLAVEQALFAIEPANSAEPPATLDGVLELDPRRGSMRRRGYRRHPDCGCVTPHTRARAPCATRRAQYRIKT